MMKRVTSVLLILVMITALCSFAFAEEELTAVNDEAIQMIEDASSADDVTEAVADEEENTQITETVAEAIEETEENTEEVNRKELITAAAAPIMIVSQPGSVYAEVSEKIVFTVVAENVVSYQWVYSRNNGGSWRNTTLTGNQSASLTIKVKEEYYPYIWKCQLTDEQGNVTETGSVQIMAPVVEEEIEETEEIVTDNTLKITAQPSDVCEEVTNKVVFTVKAENAVSYQWTYSRNNGSSWRDTTLTGNKTESLSFKVKEEYYDYIWKCVLTDENGNIVETNTIRVIKPAEPEVFEIVEQPVDTLVELGEKTKLTVVATGVASYQWIYSRNEGASWRETTLSGNKTASLTLTGKDAYYDYIWKCVLTDEEGNTLETNAVRIVEPIVILPVSIIAQPVNASAIEGQNVTFAVEAENAVSYSWMTSANQGKTWNTVFGSDAASLTITVNASSYNTLFKCVMADEAGETVETEAVTVNVPGSSKLITMNMVPVNQSAAIGETVVIRANGSNVESYDWLSSENTGATWSIASEAGNTTNELSVVVTEETYTTIYKCVMTDINGDILVTEPVGIEADSDELKIISQPVSVSLACGEIAVFTVEAKNAAAYQWQVNRDGTWLDITELDGCKQESLHVQVITNRATLKYRCRVTGILNEVVYTNTVGISILEQDLVIKGDEVVIYDVPLYYQGKYNLCWDYTQQMVEDFTLGITHTDAEVDKLCKDRAVEEYGSSWNAGGLPTDESWDVIWDDEITIEKVFEKLVENGPLYLNYNNYSMGHMVVLTGMDLSTGTMYTNNPWRVEGTQTYDQFLRMFATGNHSVSYRLPLIYVSWAEWQ